MIYPALFGPDIPKDLDDYNSNGLGSLPDAIRAVVFRELRGKYELEMQYPVAGVRFDDIGSRGIIKTSIGNGKWDLFRVYRITKPMSGVVTIRAAQICQDMTTIPVQPFPQAMKNIKDSMAELKKQSVIEHPFSLLTDRETIGTYKVSIPKNLMNCLRGSVGSLVDEFSGELDFDKFVVRSVKRLGEEKSVTIRYGKDILDLEQEQNCANIAYGVYPFWVDPSTGIVTQLDERVFVPVGVPRVGGVRILDLSTEYLEPPAPVVLRQRARNYAERNRIWEPRVNLDVSYIDLLQTEDYKDRYMYLQTINLGDTVTVDFPRLGVNTRARVTSTTYNVLTDRFERIHVGEPRRAISDTVAAQQLLLGGLSKGGNR